MNISHANKTAAAQTTIARRHRTALALSMLCLPMLLSMPGVSSAATAYLGWVTGSTTDPYVNRCAINATNSIATLPPVSAANTSDFVMNASARPEP